MTFSTASKWFKKNVTNTKETPKKRDRFQTEMEVKSRGVKEWNVTNTQQGMNQQNRRSVTNTKRGERADGTEVWQIPNTWKAFKMKRKNV